MQYEWFFRAEIIWCDFVFHFRYGEISFKLYANLASYQHFCTRLHLMHDHHHIKYSTQFFASIFYAIANQDCEVQ